MVSDPHAPYVSVTRGSQTKTRSPHLSLAECFLTSPVWAAAHAQTPVSDKVSLLSGEVTQMSKAAGLPLDQFWRRTSAGLVWLWFGVRLFPASTLTLRWANLPQQQHREVYCDETQHQPHAYMWRHDGLMDRAQYLDIRNTVIPLMCKDQATT